MPRRDECGPSWAPHEKHGKEGRPKGGKGVGSSPQTRGEKPYTFDRPAGPQDDHLLRALISPDLKRWLINISREKGMSISAYIRLILNTRRMEEEQDKR